MCNFITKLNTETLSYYLCNWNITILTNIQQQQKWFGESFMGHSLSNVNISGYIRTQPSENLLQLSKACSFASLI